MKLLNSLVLLMLICVSTLQASAQPSIVPLNEPDVHKPKLFEDLPDKQLLNIESLESLLDLTIGSIVNASIAKSITLHGTIVSKSNPLDKRVKSIVVKSDTRQGTIFTFTRLTEADGSVSYLGRMMNRRSGDALEVVKEGEGYVIQKRGVNDMINE